MEIVKKINDLKKLVQGYKILGKKVGFVPTMGYLHHGHISLVNYSNKQNDITIMSIFVNPTQFGPNEDFAKYPRDFERDCKIAKEAGVDVLFMPSTNEMYPEDFKSSINIKDLSEKLCGKSRPSHFEGVLTVVMKLFNIIQPDKAYFGQKDAQQAMLVKKMVQDFNMNLDIVVCPIIRDYDGLALSSRNAYLSNDERKQALVIPKSLFEAENMIKKGERNATKVIMEINNIINSAKIQKLDYVEILNANTLEDIDIIQGPVLILVAVYFKNARLIDNILLEV